MASRNCGVVILDKVPCREKEMSHENDVIGNSRKNVDDNKPEKKNYL